MVARTRCSRGGAREGSEDAAICTPTYSSALRVRFLNRGFDLVTGLLLVLLRPARRGRHLPRGELELDERVFERADELIIDRSNARNHISFGFGVHRCMGNRLAELQLRILWEELLPRFENIEVVGEPEYVQSNFVRGISKLMVRLTPRPSA